MFSEILSAFLFFQISNFIFCGPSLYLDLMKFATTYYVGKKCNE